MANGDRVVALKDCRLTVSAETWDFSAANAAAIDAHWQASLAVNPSYFNGVIHMLGKWTLDGGVLDGQMLRTDFKSYLYWRDDGFSDRSVRDAFGSGLIVCADRGIILGRQRAGNINAGLAYLPGGFIDARDIGRDGQVDVRGSVLRELAEETGLDLTQLSVAPGLILTLSGQQASLAYRVEVPMSSGEALARIRAFLAADPASELEDVVAVRTRRDVTAIAMPDYARLLLASILPDM